MHPDHTRSECFTPFYPYVIHEKRGNWYNKVAGKKIMAKDAESAAEQFAYDQNLARPVDILVESVTCGALRPFHIEPIPTPRFKVTSP